MSSEFGRSEFDVCGRLVMVPMGERDPLPASCKLDHGHHGAHQTVIQHRADWYGTWHWHDGAPSDRGPSLTDQILKP